MGILVIGLLLFTLPHMLREFGLRDRLLHSLPSAGAYKGLFSLVALAGLAGIIYGKSQAPFIMLWQPIYELRYISHVMMIPAIILVLAGNLPMSHIRNQLRNPMLAGVALWGAAHLWANGDLASVILFGTFCLWAAFKFIARGLTVAAQGAQGSVLWDAIAVVAGLALYALISIYHGQLFGVGLNFV